MKVFRFMSSDEFQKYQNGEKLENNTIHAAKTTAHGFCFLDLEEFDPEYSYHFLSGIVGTGVCAVFETKKKLKKATGTYAEVIPFEEFIKMSTLEQFENMFNPKSIKVNEYCTNKYDKASFHLVKYCEDFHEKYFKNDKWEWKECTKN